MVYVYSFLLLINVPFAAKRDRGKNKCNIFEELAKMDDATSFRNKEKNRSYLE